MKTVKISNLQEGDLFMYIRTNGKPIVNMSMIKAI